MDGEETWEQQDRLNRRLTQERFGENGWWKRHPPKAVPGGEDTLATIVARRRALAEVPHDEHDEETG